jgi:ATP-dependent Lon protease
MKKIYDKMSVKLKTETENNDVKQFIHKKIKYFQEIIQTTNLSIQQYKSMELFSNSDTNICMANLHELYQKTEEIYNIVDSQSNVEIIIELLQNIIDKLAVIISKYGTKNFDDLLFICFGSQYLQQKNENPYIQNKIELIRKFVQPINYKNIYWKQDSEIKMENMHIREHNEIIHSDALCIDKFSDATVQIEKSNNYECYDNDSSSYKSFLSKIYGIRVIIQNANARRTLIINGMIENIDLIYLSSRYIGMRKNAILENNTNIDMEIMTKYMNTLTLKDMLIYGDTDIFKKYMNIFADTAFIKRNNLENILKKFTEMDVYLQRNMLINLLCSNDDSIKYITYLLYDLITSNNHESINTSNTMDSREQSLIYDSFPWNVKQFFRDTMKFTIKYTQDMTQKYDMNRVSLEQQIYILNVPEYIKEKAMIKLKEIKGRTDESTSKAKQYLEGLLKIPFGIYKKEPILNIIHEINEEFSNSIRDVDDIPKKDKYTNSEIMHHLNKLINNNIVKAKKEISNHILTKKNKELIILITTIQSILKNKSIHEPLEKRTKKKENVNEIMKFIDSLENNEILMNIHNMICNNKLQYNYSNIMSVKTKIHKIDNEMICIKKTLDKSIHGHNYAKNQILKIIGQWMNGTQSGYCFGFEGSPGIGKTSLAKKGLSNCLIDADGKSRPFAFIALGGSSNGSTLEGHSYTYVNSIWGRIVDILMETKCMNPIIYVDELDKVSKTEHGKEIIGILTHLIDTTQNDCFQDKYYSGINIDLSKALFIFSYNDPDNIDRILLDRIHRIHFENLSIDEKIIIVKEHLLPEINEKMGFHETVILTDDIIKHIIDTYTIEPGIRKLKEIIFDLYGEINLELLSSSNITDIPIKIDIEDLESKYLKKYHKIQETKINEKSQVGVINGLWANSLGKGGIIPIESMFYPCSSFLELKLTGLQGDVMKESMNVAKSLAWALTPLNTKKELLQNFEDTKCQGLHIHCPQGAVSKDGPSAGTAITCAIYSLFNNKKIKNTIAITGEINLQGQITAIGGLDVKIMGGIRAGVNTFFYPSANAIDYENFFEKHKENPILENIVFVEISHISEVLDKIFE